jgi:hypothetical protein
VFSTAAFPAEHLTNLSPGFVTASDVGLDGKLSEGEMWQWNIQEVINEKTIITITGHGLDPSFHDITYYAGPPELYTGEQEQIILDILVFVPGSSGLSIGLLIAGLAGAIVFLMIRRTRRTRPV